MSVDLNNKDIKGIIRRRKGIFLAAFLPIFLVCVGIALYLPPIYQSEATIQIENQDIPEDFVKSTITTYINERLYMIKQQILSREQLQNVIKRHKLYADIDSRTEKIDRMRQDIKLETIDTAVMDERTGRAKSVTVAFKLSYEGEDPETVGAIANELSQFFVEQDLRAREELSGRTTDFFELELENLKEDVAEYETRISRFKTEHIDELPGSAGVKLQNIAFLNQDIERINTRIRTLREKKIYLESQITNVDPLAPVVSEGGKLTKSPVDQLKFLRLRLIQMQASLSPKHPDIKAIKREIAKLESQVGEANVSDEKIKLLKQMKESLATKRNTLGDNHPDVVWLTREVDTLSKEVAKQEAARSEISRLGNEKPDNPEYVNLRAQIIAADTEIGSLREERQKKQAELEDTRRKVEMIPLIEEEFNQLTLNYESARQKYNEILNKLFAAKMARQMDVSERGERFEIIESAHIPEKPYKPNRIAIILFGLVLGLFMGLSLAALQEGRDLSVKSGDDIEAILGTPVIATVSLFTSEQQKKQRRLKKLKSALVVVLAVVCISFIIDQFMMPLGQVWGTFTDRLVEMGLPIEK